jgi:2-keto-3-deoxy-6-phosphogluconate aldolase
MPTNVLGTEEATRAWIAAGVAALGVGGHLYAADLVASRDRAAIAERTRTYLGWVRDARAARASAAAPAAAPAAPSHDGAR